MYNVFVTVTALFIHGTTFCEFVSFVKIKL